MFGYSKSGGHFVFVHSVVDTSIWDSSAPQVTGCVLDDGLFSWQGLKWLELGADVCVVFSPEYVQFTSLCPYIFTGCLEAGAPFIT
jgi:hypothetical protein